MKYIDATTQNSLKQGVMDLLGLSAGEMIQMFMSIYEDTEKEPWEWVRDFLSEIGVNDTLEYIQMFHLSRRLDGTNIQTVLIFRRNYLNINDFKRTTDGWIFEEEFVHYGNKCYFSMVIHSDNIFSMYDVDYKLTKVEGKKNCFGVFIRDSKKGSVFCINRICGIVEFILRCEGKGIAYDNGKGIRKTKEDRMMKECVTLSKTQGSRVAVDVPSVVSWSVSHPFQGGGVTPR